MVQALPGCFPVPVVARTAKEQVRSEEVRTDSALLDQRSAQTPQLQRERNAQCEWLGGGTDPQTCSGWAYVGTIRGEGSGASACRVWMSDVLGSSTGPTWGNEAKTEERGKTNMLKMYTVHMGARHGESETSVKARSPGRDAG